MATEIPDGKASCRFYVRVDGIAQAVFTEVTGLAMEMTVDDVEEGGNNDFVHRLPGRCKVSNLTLKRGMTNSNDFLKWSIEIAQGKVDKAHKKNVQVILYNIDGHPAITWTFEQAYPVKWSGPQFKADDAAVAIETVELAHEGMKVS
ncbi:MAG TPA: phage tail protein [Vicinamibacterales bacterium]|nr:phage tail protein [Vicinamibacterales bacterium]